MNISQQPNPLAYAKPAVHDRGRLERLTKENPEPGKPEGAITTLIWADPFQPSEAPLPIGTKEAR